MPLPNALLIIYLCGFTITMIYYDKSMLPIYIKVLIGAMWMFYWFIFVIIFTLYQLFLKEKRKK
jgi:hypothetical protein